MSVEARFWAKVDKSGPNGCWLWTAAKFSQGYGHFVANRRHVSAHRFSYELAVGPIPDGLVLDHLCKVPACVNPGHLEPVTQKENVRRGSIYANPHCRNGHRRTEENVVVRSGKRLCLECLTARWARSRLRNPQWKYRPPKYMTGEPDLRRRESRRSA